MKKILLIILVLSLAINTYSQGKYMQTDKSAAIAGYSLINVDDVIVNAIGVGYTVERNIDFSLSYGFNDGFSSFSAGINYNLFKDKFMMVSPGLGIVHYSFTVGNKELILNGAFIGVDISGKIKMSDNFSIVPSLSVAEVFYDKVDFIDKTNATSLSFNFAFVVNTNTDFYFGIEPGVVSSNDEAGIGVSFFIIF
jgi:hypothetical protein